MLQAFDLLGDARHHGQIDAVEPGSTAFAAQKRESLALRAGEKKPIKRIQAILREHGSERILQELTFVTLQEVLVGIPQLVAQMFESFFQAFPTYQGLIAGAYFLIFEGEVGEGNVSGDKGRTGIGPDEGIDSSDQFG